MVFVRDRSGGEDNDNIGYIIGFLFYIYIAFIGFLIVILYLLIIFLVVYEFFFFFLRDKCYFFILFFMF